MTLPELSLSDWLLIFAGVSSVCALVSAVSGVTGVAVAFLLLTANSLFLFVYDRDTTGGAP